MYTHAPSLTALVDGIFVGMKPRDERVPLDEAAGFPFESQQPTRRFTQHQNKRTVNGEFWMWSTSQLVPHESWLERTHLLIIDFERWARAIASQPMRIVWRADLGVPREHVPDFFVRHVNGSCELIDVRASGLPTHRADRNFDRTGELCQALGWAYSVRYEPDTDLLANVDWLSAYRRAPMDADSLTSRIEGIAADGLALGDLLDAAEGDPFWRYMVFHLLWRRVLTFDVARRLSLGTEVQAA